MGIPAASNRSFTRIQTSELKSWGTPQYLPSCNTVSITKGKRTSDKSANLDQNGVMSRIRPASIHGTLYWAHVWKMSGAELEAIMTGIFCGYSSNEYVCTSTRYSG